MGADGLTKGKTKGGRNAQQRCGTSGQKGQRGNGNSKIVKETALQQKTKKTNHHNKQKNNNCDLGGNSAHFGYCGYCGKWRHATPSCWLDIENNASGNPNTVASAAKVMWAKERTSQNALTEITETTDEYRGTTTRVRCVPPPTRAETQKHGSRVSEAQEVNICSRLEALLGRGGGRHPWA